MEEIAILKIKVQGLMARLVLVTLLLMASSLSMAHSEELSIAVLVHPSVADTEFTTGQLRRIFSMRQPTWPDGQEVVVIALKSQDKSHLLMCKNILKMFPYQLDRLWNKLAFSGLGETPILVNSEQEMIEKLLATPGSIGYVLEPVPDINLRKVTVVGD